MNKTLSIVACTAAFIGMGVAMPQCPGDKAMQQQIDGVQKMQQTMTMKLGALDSQNRVIQGESAQSKQLMTQLASAVTAQKDAIDRLNAAVKDLETKVVALEKKPSKSKSKRRH